MKSLAQKYCPILSTPFGREGYREMSPCEILRPYVRCFWTERKASVLVIPDTCMDIIFKLGKNGETEAFFCALDDSSYYSENGGAELFGIRFYAWTAQLFSRRDLSRSGGMAFCAEEYFDGVSELKQRIQRSEGFEERAAAAEKWLTERLDGIRVNNDLLNAVDIIIDNRGTLEISEIRMHTAVSARHLERLFSRAMGISPKAFSGLVRYQSLWREMVAGDKFGMLDAVEKYGYSDQAHLLNDFRKRHGLNPTQALKYAKSFV